MKNAVTVLTENLRENPYASILCYPKPSEAELQNRLEELHEHGVKAVEFAGKANAFNIPVLGKGFVGIVVIAHLNGHRAALKIRRIDADRSGLQHEGQMLAKANTVRAGPKLISASKNFLLMQLIEGDLLPSWLETHKEKKPIRNVLADVLEQCWRLDNVGLDHGELSKAPKHVIVDGSHQPWIVDFETSSDTRKPANVTAISQYLFMGGGAVARALAEALGERSREEIIESLRFYKHAKTRENLNRLLKICLY